MSAVVVKQVIARALAEPDFRELLLNDPEKALVDLDLSPDEVMSLKSLSRGALEALALQSNQKLTRPPSLDKDK
jgi:hypothetical protein